MPLTGGILTGGIEACRPQGMAMTAKAQTMAMHPCMLMMPHSSGRELTKETAMGAPHAFHTSLDAAHHHTHVRHPKQPHNHVSTSCLVVLMSGALHLMRKFDRESVFVHQCSSALLTAATVSCDPSIRAAAVTSFVYNSKAVSTKLHPACCCMIVQAAGCGCSCTSRLTSVCMQ